MSKDEKNPVNKDWELDESFYAKEQGIREMSLEDFIEDGDVSVESPEPVSSGIHELLKAAEDIRRVLSLAVEGGTVESISKALSLDPDYIIQIQICAQSFPEDHALAIARLLVMG